MRKAVLFAALTFLLSACSDPKPPVGRWEGVLDSPDTMVAARVEIGDDGKVRVSAPDLTGLEDASAERRTVIRSRLAEELSVAWDDVEPRDFDFDGRVFRKPGGVAPQMEWDNGPGRLTVVLYLGNDPARRVPMRAVANFSQDPFSK